ncbi:hypothetical protein [Thiocystis violascens]|uniref:Uncharacterized protein n=1 Tax=Thiocystis violascens (strain ATCC 17096 / DSM 198 / 6111) TaxID=765911 RepID=I3YGW9_THIV6|nr:hypothetical protein [Thiocystis violascens]AFL76237.1 hypothetical protein Thivi_4435 [Thiocystis violascens DSM 198]
MASSDFLFSGDLYLDRKTDAGASTGYLPPIEAGQIAIEETTELKTIKSKKRDTYGQVRRTVSLKQPSKIKVTLNEVSAEILALALLGTADARSVAAGTVASGAPTEVTLIPGRFVQLPHRHITPHVDVTSPIVIETDETTPVEIPLADVEINHRAGLIRYIGATLTEATACTLTYKHAGESGTRVAGGVKPTIKVGIMMDMKNIVDGESAFLVIDEATLTPTSPVDFMGDDFLSVELEGELVTLSDKTSPYILDLLTGG